MGEAEPQRPVASSSRFSTEQLREALRWLGRQPVLLFLFVLALNAVRFPYQGRVHDAALYSFQALNRVSGGQFSGDLFFKYGSQDSFSAFSTLVSPLVNLVGLDAAFFLLYMLSVGLFYWVALRLTRAITDDVVIIALSGILIAVTPLWFGGLQIFRPNEAFFTPRLPACALSLFALERLLKGRVRGAAVCLVAALVLHPLMAGGAMLVCLAYGAWALVKERTTIGKVALAAAAASLGIVGIVVSGQYVPILDDTWRGVIRQASPNNFPADWDPSDWLTVTGSIAIVSVAAYVMRTRQSIAQLLGASVVVAICGLGLTWFASGSAHSLLFQIQPYRALWLLAVLQIPCGLMLLARWWPLSGGQRLLAIVVAAYLVRTDVPGVQLQLTLLMFSLSVGGVWLLFARRPSQKTGLLLAALSAAGGIVGVDALSGVHHITAPADVAFEFDPVGYVRLWAGTMSPLLWLAVGCTAVVFVRASAPRLTRTGLIAIVVLIQTVAMTLPATSSYKRAFFKETADMAFVQTELRRVADVRQRPLTVYMNWSTSLSIWEELGANSYFHLAQVVGVLFSRDTAMEAKRRAALAAPFEVHRYSQTRRSQPKILRLMVDRLFGDGGSAPSDDTLKRLCGESVLDFVILRKTPLLAGASTNGSVQIHDCRKFGPEPVSK